MLTWVLWVVRNACTRAIDDWAQWTRLGILERERDLYRWPRSCFWPWRTLYTKEIIWSQIPLFIVKYKRVIVPSNARRMLSRLRGRIFLISNVLCASRGDKPVLRGTGNWFHSASQFPQKPISSGFVVNSFWWANNIFIIPRDEPSWSKFPKFRREPHCSGTYGQKRMILKKYEPLDYNLDQDSLEDRN